MTTYDKGITARFQATGSGTSVRRMQDKLSQQWVDAVDLGMVADADFNGTGTDSTNALRAAVLAAWQAVATSSTADFGGTVYIPPGNYLVTGEILVPPSVRIVGGGMYSTKIFTPNAFTGRGVFVTDASTLPYSNVAGFPTEICDLAVLAASGGAYSGGGIYMNKNGCFVHDVWVAGFGNGVVLNNTDCFLYDFVSELNSYGVVVLQNATSVVNGVLHANGYGLYVQNLLRIQAASATANSIVLPATTINPSGATITTADDAFNNWVVTIVSGTGAGQQRQVTDYVGASRTMTFASAWTTPPDATSQFTVEFDNGTVNISDVRVQPSNQYGFQIYRSKRVQLSNCGAAGSANSFLNGALAIEESTNVIVNNFNAQCSLWSGGAATDRDGIRIISSNFVTLSGGNTAYFRDGIVVDGGQNISIENFQSSGNTRRGALLNGGSQLAITGGTYSNNGTTGGANDCGIESTNSATDAVHTITGVQTNGLGGVQDHGIRATLTGSGWTHITGCNSRYNATNDLLLTDTAANGRLVTASCIPSGATVPNVASAATITIPPNVVLGGSETVRITGTTGITSITATGYTGARVTLIFDAALTVTDGSNLKLAGNFTSTADDTLSLRCDGTNWFETGRSAN